MLTRATPGWKIRESAATPESVFRDRRRILSWLAAAPLLAGARIARAAIFEQAPTADPSDPSFRLYPFSRSDRYSLDRPITDEAPVLRFNNFFEFSGDKRAWPAAQKLATRPWIVKVDGLVARPFEIDIDALLAEMPLEERTYRHRCVEAWAMAVPWSGFPLKALVERAKPLGEAKYVRFETFLDRSISLRQLQAWMPWPYVEALTMTEATNELAFLATGLYGKPLAKQNGAPIRLVVPWKYGFKSIKSIVRVSFVEQRPISFWERMNAKEYGFWANVNPKVPHPDWSQETEVMLGSQEEVPTQLFNGYGGFVAHLYRGLEREPLYR